MFVAQPPAIPPPVIDSARLLAYASVDDSIEFTDHAMVIVDGRPLGRVPRLAICRQLDDDAILLFYCDEWWQVLGTTICVSPDAARERAEGGYRGITAKWVDANVSVEEMDRFLRGEGDDVACSFCGRLPHQVRRLIGGRNAWICDACVKNLHEIEGGQTYPDA